jgi:hypothetical protein
LGDTINCHSGRKRLGNGHDNSACIRRLGSRHNDFGSLRWEWLGNAVNNSTRIRRLGGGHDCSRCDRRDWLGTRALGRLEYASEWKQLGIGELNRLECFRNGVHWDWKLGVKCFGWRQHLGHAREFDNWDWRKLGSFISLNWLG